MEGGRKGRRGGGGEKRTGQKEKNTSPASDHRMALRYDRFLFSFFFFFLPPKLENTAPITPGS